MPEHVIDAEAAVGPSFSSTTHEIRITTGGKISNWVEFALKFLQNSPDAKLILHTLPLDLKGKGKAPTLPITSEAQEQPSANANEVDISAKKSTGMQPSTTAIAKLISVTEIIKREYLKLLDGSLVGLYQYNELGTLEDLGLAPQLSPDGDSGSDVARSQAIIQALEGVKNVRIKCTPYMRITLSPKEILDLSTATHPTTAQRPEKRQLTKSAKGRLKKRLKKAAQASSTSGTGNETEAAHA